MKISASIYSDKQRPLLKVIQDLVGHQMDLLKSKFWQHVCSWAFMSGASNLEASVSPAVARIIKRYGFTPVYTTMRLNLTEM